MLQQGVLREPSLIKGKLCSSFHQARQASLGLAYSVRENRLLVFCRHGLDGLISLSALLAPPPLPLSYHLWPSRFEPKPLRKGAPPLGIRAMSCWPATAAGGCLCEPSRTGNESQDATDPSRSKLTGHLSRLGWGRASTF